MPRFHRPTAGSSTADADFRPNSSDFGTTLAETVTCRTCGHGSLGRPPSLDALISTYAHVGDSDEALEDQGRAATAERDLRRLTEVAGAEGGKLVDIGCWTGGLVDVASRLGWSASGIEPSGWAVRRAVVQGRNVRQGVLGEDDGFCPGEFTAVTCCDVLEHLLEPQQAVARIFEILEPDGVLFVTVPDAGSAVARALGPRWWSVMPMHVQYFTRASLVRLLTDAGLEIVDVSSHAKTFSRRYYGDRLGEFLPVVGPLVARIIARAPGADRAFAPDFRDRIAVIARRPGLPTPEDTAA